MLLEDGLELKYRATDDLKESLIYPPIQGADSSAKTVLL